MITNSYQNKLFQKEKVVACKLPSLNIRLVIWKTKFQLMSRRASNSCIGLFQVFSRAISKKPENITLYKLFERQKILCFLFRETSFWQACISLFGQNCRKTSFGFKFHCKNISWKQFTVQLNFCYSRLSLRGCQVS